MKDYSNSKKKAQENITKLVDVTHNGKVSDKSQAMLFTRKKLI